jgi:hypothetical protein
VTAYPRYRLEIEALPSNNGTVASRLERALKTLAWYRLRVRSVEEAKDGMAAAAIVERSAPITTREPS